jgi:hypothetical protein
VNALSQLIYAADVANGASGLLSFVSGMSFISAGISFIAAVVMGPEPDCYSWEDKEAKRAWRTELRGKLSGAVKPLLVSFVVCALIATVIPSKDTIYAIAASEMGERALQTPTADKAVQALNAWLDRQIAPAKDGGK